MTDLFSYHIEKQLKKKQSLSDKLRPSRWSDLVGQDHILQLPWIKTLSTKTLPHLVLWGPPGSGKTSFANILRQVGELEFFDMHANDFSTRSCKELIEKIKTRLGQSSKQPVLFIDEVHRLNKSQQDLLLPHLERNVFSFIGATTENPGYELNSALISRCHVITFQRLKEPDLKTLMLKAIQKKDLLQPNLLTQEACQELLEASDGDARKLLNRLEILFSFYDSKPQFFPADIKKLKEFFAETTYNFNRKSDEHYDALSAYIKSMRSSDINASLYYLARMLRSSEDPKTIARRLIIFASEDVGLADPNALPLAVSAFEAVEKVGLPEAAICLSHVTAHLAATVKSRSSYKGLLNAYALFEKTGTLPIPSPLINPKKWSISSQSQSNLPKSIEKENIFEFGNKGFESKIKAFHENQKKSVPAISRSAEETI